MVLEFRVGVIYHYYCCHTRMCSVSFSIDHSKALREKTNTETKNLTEIYVRSILSSEHAPGLSLIYSIDISWILLTQPNAYQPHLNDTLILMQKTCVTRMGGRAD